MEFSTFNEEPDECTRFLKQQNVTVTKKENNIILKCRLNNVNRQFNDLFSNDCETILDEYYDYDDYESAVDGIFLRKRTTNSKSSGIIEKFNSESVSVMTENRPTKLLRSSENSQSLEYIANLDMVKIAEFTFQRHALKTSAGNSSKSAVQFFQPGPNTNIHLDNMTSKPNIGFSLITVKMIITQENWSESTALAQITSFYDQIKSFTTYLQPSATSSSASTTSIDVTLLPIYTKLMFALKSLDIDSKYLDILQKKVDISSKPVEKYAKKLISDGELKGGISKETRQYLWHVEFSARELCDLLMNGDKTLKECEDAVNKRGRDVKEGNCEAFKWDEDDFWE